MFSDKGPDGEKKGMRRRIRRYGNFGSNKSCVNLNSVILPSFWILAPVFSRIVMGMSMRERKKGCFQTLCAMRVYI